MRGKKKCVRREESHEGEGGRRGGVNQGVGG